MRHLAGPVAPCYRRGVARHQIVAAVCAFVAVVDLAIAFWLVGPRLRVEQRLTFRLGMLGGAAVMLALSAAFWFKKVPVG